MSAAAAASAHDEDDDIEQLRASIAGVVIWSEYVVLIGSCVQGTSLSTIVVCTILFSLSLSF